MTELKFMLGAGLALLLIGCTNNQPSFDPGKKEIRTVDGKHYRVPYGASTSRYAVSSNVIKNYQEEFGLSDCRDGDITWEDQKTADTINEVMRSGEKSEGIAIYKKAATEGRIGCSSPLSDKEYQASLKK